MARGSGKLLDKRIHRESRHKWRHKHWVGHNDMGMGLDTNLHTRLAFGNLAYWGHLDTLAQRTYMASLGFACTGKLHLGSRIDLDVLDET